jgi:c-di-GMP-binding flagellar brake protein YcgR
MPLWTFWRGGDTEAPTWGKSPAIRAGETVRLQVGGEDHIGMHPARVRAIGMRRIILDADIDIAPRETLTLFYARGDALYHFATRAVGPSRRGTVTIAFPREVVRLQRRQFYRLPLESPTTFRALSADGRINSAPVPARLVNLSGGGALLSVAKSAPLPAGVEVSVRIPVGASGEPIPVDAEVLDCLVASQGVARVYLIRLRFFGPPRLTAEDREAIVAFIHEQQRMMLKTRKLLSA